MIDIAYHAAMAIMTAYMCFRWSSNDLLNATMKLSFFAGSIWSILRLGADLGYVVQL